MVSELHNRPVSGRVPVPGHRRRLSIALAAAAVGATLLTGCAAGQHAQTAAEIPVADGALADSGTIGIRNAGVLAPQGANYAPGGDASLQMVIINNGTANDKLTSVSSGDAGAAMISLTGASQSSGSGSATDSSSASSSATSASAITIPANSSVQVGYSDTGASITLTGLTMALYPAQSVPVTLTFASGATITATLPVKLSPSAASAPTIDVSPSGG